VVDFATVVIPGLAWFEKEGTFINFEGMVQKLNPSLDPPSKELKDDLYTFAKIGKAIHGEDLHSKASKVFEAMANHSPYFKDMDYFSIGDEGEMMGMNEGEDNE